MNPSRAARGGAVAVVAAVCLLMPAGVSGASAASTVVSLTFDDAYADQAPLRSMLSARGIQATFVVNSQTIERSGRLTWAQLEELGADGQEIAGHTLDHVDLTSVSTAEARRQICDDRANLVAHGFAASAFAYPHGAHDPSVESIAEECGYAAARTVGGIVSPGKCSACPYAETIPPRNPRVIATPDSIRSTTTLAQMQTLVSQAESHGGGWVVLVMHHICDGCSESAISASTLTAFLDWLAPRAADGTVVRTLSAVIAAPPSQPPVVGPSPSPNPCGAPTSPSLSTCTSTTSPALKASQLISLPSARACVSRRRLRIRLRQRNGVSVASVNVKVNGKVVVKVLRARRLTRVITLRRLPTRRFTVQVTVTTSQGQTLRVKRTYRPCAARR